MAMAGILLVCLLLVGCVSNTVNMSVGDGGHTLGPKTDKKSKWESSKDSQENTDSIKEMSSKISGIDKSQNEIKRSVDKTSTSQQQMQTRDEAIDKLNPNLPKEQRQLIHKGQK